MPRFTAHHPVTLAGLVAVLLVGACTGATPSPETTTTYPAVDTYPDVGIDLTSTVDPFSGSITFPFARLTPSEEETALFWAASAMVTAQCAQERGVDWRAAPVSTYSTLYDSSIYFGVWTTDQANRFAFSLPSTNADLSANEVAGADASANAVGTPEQPDLSELRAARDHNRTVSEADGEVVKECAGSAESDRLSGLSLFTGPWISTLTEATRPFDTHPEVVQARTELDTCLVDAGLTVDPDSPGYPMGTDVGRIDEEQIQLALQVVDCKTRIDYVPRLADAMARLEAPVLVEYADELLEERAKTDALVAEARAILTAAQTKQ